MLFWLLSQMLRRREWFLRWVLVGFGFGGFPGFNANALRHGETRTSSTEEQKNRNRTQTEMVGEWLRESRDVPVVSVGGRCYG